MYTADYQRDVGREGWRNGHVALLYVVSLVPLKIWKGALSRLMETVSRKTELLR